MCERECRKILILVREAGKLRDRVDKFSPDDRERIPHKNNVRIIADVAGCGSKVNNSSGFGALQTVGVYMGHDIVADLFFARFGIRVIDVLRMSLELRDLLVGDIKSEFLFRLGESDPQLSPGAELAVR